MKISILFLVIVLLYKCRGWEYCQSNIQSKLCGKQHHFVCDSKNSISKPSYISKDFLAHVPLTKKVKVAFLKWHNYYRNRTAGGWSRNKNMTYFPRAIRMRELIWDRELSYLSHTRTKLVTAGEVNCLSTLRFPSVEQNMIVEAQNDLKPVLKIIALSLRKMFNEKNLISNPAEMNNNFLQKTQFTTMVNDRVSRLGCAVALGGDCIDKKRNPYKYCYYTACTYDYGDGGLIYKVGKPTGRCSIWESGRSKTYINLCANSGKIFVPDN